jgi:hypothetical protein
VPALAVEHSGSGSDPEQACAGVADAEGGFLTLGALLEIGDVTPNPQPPEIEDHMFTPERAPALGQPTTWHLWRSARAPRSHLAIDLRCGNASLAGAPALLPVTDLRFVEADHVSIRTDVVADVNARMRLGVTVLPMLGLARPYGVPGDDRERHWLQVNGRLHGGSPAGATP